MSLLPDASFIILNASKIKTYIDPGGPKTVSDSEPELAGVFACLLHVMANPSARNKLPLLPNLGSLFLSGRSALFQIRLLCPTVETFHLRHIYVDFENCPPADRLEDALTQALSHSTSLRSLDIDWADSNASPIVPVVLER
jgi:hypothetical protein